MTVRIEAFEVPGRGALVPQSQAASAPVGCDAGVTSPNPPDIRMLWGGRLVEQVRQVTCDLFLREMRRYD